MNRFLRRRRARGAAAVETGILMVVLVPLIMYTLFLEDVLFYKLDLAESVFSSAWDFHHQDYRHSNTADISWAAQHNNRLTFADHTSAWNTYSDPTWDTDTGHAEHHQALTAHQCWLAQGAEQVTCTVNGAVGSNVANEFSGATFNKGGQSTCHATLGVENYFIPQKFFQWWAKNDMTNQKRWTGESGQASIHDNAQQDPYVFPEERFSILFDPWALNYLKASGSTDLGSGHSAESMLQPDSHPADMGNEWYDWMNKPYSDNSGKLQAAKDFADQAIQKEVLSQLATVDGTGDSIDTPPLAWSTSPQREFNSHTASGWEDNRHSQTQGAMRNNYMGVDENKW